MNGSAATDRPTFDGAKEQALSYVRSEMLTSLDTFLAHTKYTITLLSSLLTAGGALVAFAYNTARTAGSEGQLVSYAAIACFLLLPVMAYVSYRIVYRYYKIYVSNYVYSARLHLAVGAYAKHPWLEEINKQFDVFSDHAVKMFIDGEGAEEPHSWKLYKFVISAFGILGLVLAGATQLWLMP